MKPLILLLLFSLLSLTGCGDSDDSGSNEEWNTLEWDQDNWQ
ncbi:MAG: hypothetical protein AAF353_16160 [Pseudomonadota bacterium]